MKAFSSFARSRVEFPTSISTSLGSAPAASVEMNGREAHDLTNGLALNEAVNEDP